MTKNEWLKMFEEGSFVNTMFQLYLKRTGQFDSLWDEVIGSKFHRRDNVWDSIYDTVDGDFVEVFITTADDNITRKIVLFSDFLDWCEKRKQITDNKV